MARFSDVNSTVTAIGDILYRWKTVLKAAGWVCKASSDGVTYNSSGDQITTGSTGAGGFNVVKAWWRGQDPSGRREALLQTIAIGSLNVTATCRVIVSELGKFTGGSPSATVTPSCSDPITLAGGGTDAVPTGSSWASSGITTVRIHCTAESAAVGGVYGWGIFSTNPAAATQAPGQFFCEPMAPGSYDAGDVSPCAWYGGPNSTFTGAATGWCAYGTGSQIQATMTLNAGIYNGALGVDPVGGTDPNGYGTWSYTFSAATRRKGVGSAVALKGPARTYPATANTGTDAKVYLGSYVYPYPNSTVPSVS